MNPVSFFKRLSAFILVILTFSFCLPLSALANEYRANALLREYDAVPAEPEPSAEPTPTSEPVPTTEPVPTAAPAPTAEPAAAPDPADEPRSAASSANNGIMLTSTAGDFDYTVIDSTYAQITGYNGSAADVVIPSTIDGYTVTSIGKNAFYGKSSIASVSLPDTLTTIHTSAFEKCTSLGSIVLPDSVTTLASNSFAYCTALNDITLSKNWSVMLSNNGIAAASKYISSPFIGCTALTSIAFPEGATRIPNDALEDCSFITSITIPSTVTEIDNYAFAGTGITSISIPSSVTMLGESCFRECKKLKNIAIPDNVTSIPPYAFYGCTALSSVAVTHNIRSISNYAFSGCTALDSISIPSVTCSFGTQVFDNCKDFTVHCKWISSVFFYVLENNYAYKLLDPSAADFAEHKMDMAKTSLYSPHTSSTLSGFVPMTLNYSIAEGERGTFTTQRLIFKMLPGLELVHDSIYINGKEKNVTVNSKTNSFSVDITEPEGTVALYVRPIESCKAGVLAQFEYLQTGASSYKTETIGLVVVDSPFLFINPQSFITSPEFDVAGLALASTPLNFYIDGQLAGSTTALKDGTYSAKLIFPFTPESGQDYTLCVKHADGSAELSTTIAYSNAEPELASFVMYYDAHSPQQMDLLKADGAYMINPTKPLKFIIKFNNYENLGRVFVISTRNDIDKRIYATPTGNPGEYIAEGYFDANNYSYVPGKLHVGYTTMYTAEDLLNDCDNSELADIVRSATVTGYDENSTASDQTAIIDLGGDNGTIEVETHEDLTIDDLRAMFLGQAAPVQPASVSAYSSVTEDEDVKEMLETFVEELGKKYSSNVISNASEVYVEQASDTVTVVRTNEDTISYIFFDSAKKAFKTVTLRAGLATMFQQYDYPGTSWKSCYSNAGTAISAGKAVFKFGKSAIELDDARHAISTSPNLSAADREYANNKLDSLALGYGGVCLLRITSIIVPKMLTAAGHPVAGVLAGMVMNYGADFLESYLDDAMAFYVAGGKGSFLKWLIDPSGYVYDITTGERLAGVTATLYGIELDLENDDYDSFFADKPADNEYGQLWDAAQHSQHNPQITKADGEYAWDTPIGWWRVKFEKPGYKTAWSEWLAVPPIQTDINVGLESSRGDVNGDNAINIKDLIMLCRYLVGQLDENAIIPANCCIDQREGITISDAIALAKLLQA